MSAASFLGSPRWCIPQGMTALIYSLRVLVGWPIILFLIAERLRNSGRYTLC